MNWFLRSFKALLTAWAYGALVNPLSLSLASTLRRGRERKAAKAAKEARFKEKKEKGAAESKCRKTEA